MHNVYHDMEPNGVVEFTHIYSCTQGNMFTLAKLNNMQRNDLNERNMKLRGKEMKRKT